MLLQPSVPVAEQCTQSRCDDRCGGTQRCAELKCDAVTDNGFGVAIGRHGALVTPSAHAHHRGSLVETASPIQFAFVDSQRFRATRHRHGHRRPHFVVDAFRRDHTRPHLTGRRFDDALSFDDHHGLRYPDKTERHWATSRSSSAGISSNRRLGKSRGAALHAETRAANRVDSLGGSSQLNLRRSLAAEDV